MGRVSFIHHLENTWLSRLVGVILTSASCWCSHQHTQTKSGLDVRLYYLQSPTKSVIYVKHYPEVDDRQSELLWLPSDRLTRLRWKPFSRALNSARSVGDSAKIDISGSATHFEQVIFTIVQRKSCNPDTGFYL